MEVESAMSGQELEHHCIERWRLRKAAEEISGEISRVAAPLGEEVHSSR